MAAPYSIDLRERVLETKLSGKYTNQEIADIFFISLASVKKYYAQYLREGSVAPKKPPGRPSTVSEIDKNHLKNQVLEEPDATLEEHCDMFKLRHGKTISRSNMHLIFTKLGLSRKKKPIC